MRDSNWIRILKNFLCVIQIGFEVSILGFYIPEVTRKKSVLNYSLAAPLQTFQMGLIRQVELPLQVPPSRVLTRCTRVLHKRQKFLILSVGKKALASLAVGLLVLCPLIVFLDLVHSSLVCNLN